MSDAISLIRFTVPSGLSWCRYDFNFSMKNACPVANVLGFCTLFAEVQLLKTLIHNDWQTVLEPIFESSEYARLHGFLKKSMPLKRSIPRCIISSRPSNGPRFMMLKW